MEWTVTEQTEAAGCRLEVSAGFAGEDILICLQGGDRPHLGCVVQTEPRKSLTGDGSVSATSSVLNFPGHKDEAICRWLSERVAAKLNRRVICTGGFHKDGISQAEIREIQAAVEYVTKKLVQKLLNVHQAEEICLAAESKRMEVADALFK